MRPLLALLGGLAGYAVAAIAAYLLIGALSSNGHDRALEAAMSAAFVFGPLGGVVGLIVGWVRGGRGARGDD